MREKIHKIWLELGCSQDSYDTWDRDDEWKHEADLGRLDVVLMKVTELMDIKRTVSRAVSEIRCKLDL